MSDLAVTRIGLAKAAALGVFGLILMWFGNASIVADQLHVYPRGRLDLTDFVGDMLRIPLVDVIQQSTSDDRAWAQPSVWFDVTLLLSVFAAVAGLALARFRWAMLLFATVLTLPYAPLGVISLIGVHNINSTWAYQGYGKLNSIGLWALVIWPMALWSMLGASEKPMNLATAPQ